MTTLNNLDGINSTGGIVRQMRVLRQSDTLKAPTDGKMLLMVVAAAASGALVANATATQRVATGGGAGEAAWDVVDVAKDDTFTVTIGAPGAGISSTAGVAAAINGNDASNTTVTGPNSYALTVVGGKKGLAATGTASVSGGAGGTDGVGGTSRVIRAPGGRGGSVSSAAGSAMIATGGGAVNAMMRTAQTDTRGGDSTSTNTAAAIATGGGAPGGRAGDRTGSGTGTTGGGGAGGPATDNALTAGPNIIGLASQASPAWVSAALAAYGIDYFGGGTDGASSIDAGPGGGLGGNTINSASRIAGVFAASGAIVITSSANPFSYSPGTPGFGAGSAAVVSSVVNDTVVIPAGGKAIVVAIFIEEA